MAIKKSQIYRMLWDGCDVLRGAMDASQYKDYVLMILFVKYLTDKESNETSLYEIPDGCRFPDFVALKGTAEIGESINKKLEAIKARNIMLFGKIALPNFNDPAKFGKPNEMRDTLSKLIAVFENSNLDFSRNRSEGDDLLGDAYEYLMKNFAAESGKSKGQFYTPSEVSRTMAKMLRLDKFDSGNVSICDPTCGSGSLLLRAFAETRYGAALFGQEKDNSTASLAILNMILHGADVATIEQGDTINSPQFVEGGHLKTFDIVVANPPFSTKSWLGSAGENDIYQRWSKDLCPPPKCGDYAFLKHIIATLKPNAGRGACILPHGVLFRGNAEYNIRKDILQHGWIEGIVGLPANIFFGTGIPACIIMLNKAGAANRKGVFFIDASRGFIKDGNKNRLREQDIRKIVDVWLNREVIPHYSRFVEMERIAKEDFNLNIPRYVEPLNDEETQNLDGHLNGGISAEEIEALGRWEAFPGLKDELLEVCRPGFFRLRVAPDEVAETVRRNRGVTDTARALDVALDGWAAAARVTLSDLAEKPPRTIDRLAFAMRDLPAFAEGQAIDKYDAFGVVMNYALETMQDDLYLVGAEGWLAGREIEAERDKKGKIRSWEGAIIPKEILTGVYFASERLAVENLAQQNVAATEELEQFIEQCADNDNGDLLAEIRDEDEKLVKDAEVRKTLRLLRTDASREAETAAVAKYVDLRTNAANAARALRDAEAELDRKAYARYATLTEAECRELIIERKWFAAIRQGIQTLFTNLLQNFAASVVTLHERYAHTLAELEHAAAESQNDVHAVLREMGFDWKGASL